MAKTLIKVQRGATEKNVQQGEPWFSDFLHAGQGSAMYKAAELQVTVVL